MDSLSMEVDHTLELEDLDAREALIKAGVKLVAERGYDGASIGDITQLAKVSKGAFYYHFASKEDFVLSILKQRTSRNTERFRQLSTGISSVSEWIESSFSIIIGFPAKDLTWQQFSLEVMMAGMRAEHARIGEHIADLHVEWRALLTEMITNSDEHHQGLICCEPEIIAVAIMALVDGFLMHSDLERPHFTRERFAERLAPLLKLWVAQPDEAAA